MKKTVSVVTGIVVGMVALARPVAADLVGHWKFDEGSGTSVLDSSGLGNHGLLINPAPTTRVKGHQGGGLNFDGTTGSGATYVSIPDAPSLRLTNVISFAAWVRCDDIYRDAPILDKEGDGKLSYWFGTYGASGAAPGNFGLLLSANGNQPWNLFDRDQGAVPQGLWTHVASTWDGATTRHYVNGVLLPQTASFAGPIHVSDAALIIGANVPYNTTAFKGIIDDARLYNHVLSASEIRALAGVTNGMVGHWTFDEGAGTSIADLSGAGNNGTLINLKTNTWTTGKFGSALYFDGSTGANAAYVNVPDSTSLRIAGGITFAAWIRCDDINRDAPILAKEGTNKLSYWFGAYGAGGSGPGNYGVLLNADGNDVWTVQDRATGSVPVGQWVHLAATWDGNLITHYFNGQALPQTATFNGPIHASDAFLGIGENSAKGFTAFQGAIDEVFLYNYALSAAEVRALYQVADFKITAVSRVGDGVLLSWLCIPGHSYIVQTNATSGGGLGGVFGDYSAPIAVPTNFTGTATNFVDAAAGTNSQARYYRIKQLP